VSALAYLGPVHRALCCLRGGGRAVERLYGACPTAGGAARDLASVTNRRALCVTYARGVASASNAHVVSGARDHDASGANAPDEGYAFTSP